MYIPLPGFAPTAGLPHSLKNQDDIITFLRNISFLVMAAAVIVSHTVDFRVAGALLIGALVLKLIAERTFTAWVWYMQAVQTAIDCYGFVPLSMHQACYENTAAELLKVYAQEVKKAQSVSEGVYSSVAIKTKREFEKLFRYCKILGLIPKDQGYGEYFKD